ncbi:MAG: hypothetical protein ABSG73_10625 [Candidatus Aminicenantales bacterium]
MNQGPRHSALQERLRIIGKNYLVPTALILCFLFSLLMAILKPIPHGHAYHLMVNLTFSLLFVWFLYRVRPEWVFRKGFLAAVVLVGLGLGVLGFLTIHPDAEIVYHYDTAFVAMRNGQNPYTSGTIFHRGESSQTVYGNFNYPPMEIYPYFLARLFAGRWNIGILTIVFLLLRGLVCWVFIRTFPEIRRKYLWPFFPIFLFAEIHINSAMTFLALALILWAIRKEKDRPQTKYRVIIAVLFGIGLMTKFLIAPIMAAYYWNKFEAKRLQSLIDIAADAGLAVATAVLIMVPYGVRAVFKSTILFNLILKSRDTMTTFFPNVLSGFFSWVGASGLYPAIALALLALSVLAAPRLRPFSAMLASASTFLLVAPIPRSQFIPIVLYLAVAGIYVNAEKGRTLPPDILRPAPPDAAHPAHP